MTVSPEQVTRRIAVALARMLDPGGRGAMGVVVDRLMAAIDAHWHRRRYSAVPPEVAQADAETRAQHGAAFANQAWQVVLMRYCERSLAQGLPRIPPALTESVRVHFVRLIEHVTTDLYASGDRPPLSRDYFRKDLGIARLTMLPANARLCDVYAGIPRRYAVSHFPASLPLFAKALLVNGGLRFYFGTHMHRPLYARFNREGWVADYGAIAQYLEAMPEIRGTLSYGWMLDRAMLDLSPHLAHNRTIPEAYGAVYLELDADAATVNLAVSTSRTRRQAYDDGRYVPHSYLALWGRADILRWYADYRAGRFTIETWK